MLKYHRNRVWQKMSEALPVQPLLLKDKIKETPEQKAARKASFSAISAPSDPP